MKEMILRARENSEDMMKVLSGFEPLVKKAVKIYISNFNLYEDGYQQARLTIIKCVRSYDIDSSYPFLAYVKRAVYYSVRDYSRKITTGDTSLDEEIGDDSGCLYDIIDSGMHTEETVVYDDDVKRLYEALEKLPEKQRKIIFEFYFENKSMVEICRNRRCHYMSVVGMKDRAIKRLREEMRVVD